MRIIGTLCVIEGGGSRGPWWTRTGTEHGDNLTLDKYTFKRWMLSVMFWDIIIITVMVKPKH